MSATSYPYTTSENHNGKREGRSRNRKKYLSLFHLISIYLFLARYDTRNKDLGVSPTPSYLTQKSHHYHRRPLSPVSVGDVCNRITKVSFDNCKHIKPIRMRNRSAELHQSDKPHETRPPSVSAIRSVVPDRLQQDQIPICFRPDSGGTKGQPIALYTNHFKCYLPNNLAIVRMK